MGIQDLSKILEPYKERICLEDIEGFRVGVDISIYLYRYVRSAKIWTDLLIDLVKILRKRYIKPVFVFDGPNIPQDKYEESKRRREQERKQKEKYQKLCEIKLLRDGTNTGSIRSLLKSFFPKDDLPTGTFELEKYIDAKREKMSFQTRQITADIVNTAKKIITILGFPIIQADGEAETMCVNLCYSGKIDAILSEDSDVLAYNGGDEKNIIMLSGLRPATGELFFISKTQLLIELNLQEDSFRDMCILLSCDYNKRIRGFGPVKVAAQIDKYGNIEAMIQHEVIKEDQISMTNYEKCREIFTCKYTTNAIPINSSVDNLKLQEFLHKTDSNHTVEGIIKFWASILK